MRDIYVSQDWWQGRGGGGDTRHQNALRFLQGLSGCFEEKGLQRCQVQQGMWKPPDLSRQDAPR